MGFLLPFNVEALLTPFGALLDMLNNRRLCRCAAGTYMLGCMAAAGRLFPRPQPLPAIT